VRFRHYDPTPGMRRWLERDPAGYQDGPSLYSYLGRNPMAGTDPYGLWFADYWEDFKEGFGYFGGGLRGNAERILQENRRLLERHLERQLESGLISSADRRWQSYDMRTDIDQALGALHVIESTQREQVIETEIAITISLIPVGDVAATSVNGVRAIRTATAARNAGAAAGSWGAAAKAGRASRITKTTILGENMAGRVIPFVERTGARTLPFAKKSTKEWSSLTRRQQWKLNDGALRARIREGDAFRYIGRDPERSGAERLFDLTGSELLWLTERGVRYDLVPASEVLRVLGRP
jgi:hypothetical protein